MYLSAAAALDNADLIQRAAQGIFKRLID